MCVCWGAGGSKTGEDYRSHLFPTPFHNPHIKLTLSKPCSSSLLPRTSPIPDRAVTGLSPMGSATKSLCFWEVLDIPRPFAARVFLYLPLPKTRPQDQVKLKIYTGSIKATSGREMSQRTQDNERSQIIDQFLLATGSIFCFVSFLRLGHFRYKFGLFLIYFKRTLWLHKSFHNHSPS